MKINNVTYLLIIVVLITFCPNAGGKNFYSPDINVLRTESDSTIKIKHPIALAENEANVAEKESKPAAAEQRIPESEEEAAETNSKNSGDKKTKPVKPFVPSEEIAAEQAVDFPSDI